jgi:hypothetical protein
MKELVKKVKLLEPVEIDKINIVKDHYFSNAYIIDLPLDPAPDTPGRTFLSGNGRRAEICGKENYS